MISLLLLVASSLATIDATGSERMHYAGRLHQERRTLKQSAINSRGYIDCYFESGKEYMGFASVTFDGYECAKWSEDNYGDNVTRAKIREVLLAREETFDHNHCRNPLSEFRSLYPVPFCYPKKKRQHSTASSHQPCKIIKCEEYCRNTRPCFNGGTCVPKAHGYGCSCTPGFQGYNCETLVNECASQPCKNGAKCLDRIARFECNCTAEYAGDLCEENLNKCASNPCQNGGVCKRQAAGGYVCQCGAVYSGVHCEKSIGAQLASQVVERVEYWGAHCASAGPAYYVGSSGPDACQVECEKIGNSCWGYDYQNDGGTDLHNRNCWLKTEYPQIAPRTGHVCVFLVWAGNPKPPQMQWDDTEIYRLSPSGEMVLVQSP